jgi:hypothetical protein
MDAAFFRLKYSREFLCVETNLQIRGNNRLAFKLECVTPTRLPGTFIVSPSCLSCHRQAIDLLPLSNCYLKFLLVVILESHSRIVHGRCSVITIKLGSMRPIPPCPHMAACRYMQTFNLWAEHKIVASLQSQNHLAFWSQ